MKDSSIEPIEIDEDTAVIVAAGPSLDRLSPTAWSELGQAGAIVAVNGAFMARACLDHEVPFTHAAAMTSGEHMEETVPGYLHRWNTTSAWRLTREADRDSVEAESYVQRILEWSDDPDGGYFGGSTAMSSSNWLHNDWPTDINRRVELEAISQRTGKAIPRRGYRKFIFVGLDMVPNQGGHAGGAGSHVSGFTSSPGRDDRVRTRWGLFHQAACERGSTALNLSPGTGLKTLPHREPPARWLLDKVAAGRS